jgi:hypothetical protein
MGRQADVKAGSRHTGCRQTHMGMLQEAGKITNKNVKNMGNVLYMSLHGIR